MDKDEVATRLKALTPKTHYAAFLEIWPQVEDAIERRVQLNAIWSKLSESGLSVSYTTFTRFVKKKMQEDAEEGTSGRPSKRMAVATAAHGAQAPAPPEPIDTPDKSEQVVSQASSALDQARHVSATKDYSKLAPRRGGKT
jgi:hypothetical protein